MQRLREGCSTCWLLLFLLCGAVGSAASAGLPANALGGHASPYLALHADDPVRWQTWNADTLALARRLGRPLFVSSGFFSCHWCHVMQRESFRDARIAALLNTAFVPVKLDREIDTALDDQLIGFVRAAGGVAGWPLNVVVTPSGRPWHGFSYLPPEALDNELRTLASRWSDAPSGAIEAALEAAAAAPEPPGSRLEREALRALVRDALLADADDFEGGFGVQAKFPFPSRLAAILRLYPDDPSLRDFVAVTLDAIVTRGLRDHVGGGFFRYTVDPGWETPHFEKMLADNAQLAELLLDAADAFDRPDWRGVARETLDFMLRELRRADGWFMSSLSAVDAAGREGLHYLWSPVELGRTLRGDELRLAARRYGLMRPPAFARGHLLRPLVGLSAIADESGRSRAEVEALAEAVRARLLAARAATPPPADDKAVLAWNGLVLRALARAAALDPAYSEAGRRLAERIEGLVRLPALPRAIGANGVPLGSALLEDYALLADGLTAWSRVRGEPRFARQAEALADAAWRRFGSAQGSGWRAGADTGLAIDGRFALLPGGHQPSATAVLLRLAHGLAARDARWRARAEALSDTAQTHVATRPVERVEHLPGAR